MLYSIWSVLYHLWDVESRLKLFCSPVYFASSAATSEFLEKMRIVVQVLCVCVCVSMW